MAVTIRDVAELAGVGRGTVSRVLNDSPRVDPDTRLRVLDVMRLLDYQPSQLARRLSLGRSQTIAAVVPSMRSQSVAERLGGIQQALRESGYDLIVVDAETATRRDNAFAQLPRRSRADGVIAISLAPRPAELRQFQRTGMPLVLLDAHHRRVPRVQVDDVEGGGAATRHLIELGHRRLAFVDDTPWSESSRLRRFGFRRAIAAAGLAIPLAYEFGHDTGEDVAERVRSLFSQASPPTALVCSSDQAAMAAVGTLRRLGLRIPSDVSVIGYDDIEGAAWFGLTTIRQPLIESGRQAAELLLGAIEGRRTRRLAVELPIELIVRETTGPPPEPLPAQESDELAALVPAPAAMPA